MAEERTLQDLTDEALETWQASAADWERNADLIDGMSKPVRAWLLEQLDPQPGQTILELGAGPGDTGFDAARLVGEGGRLISTDISPFMVDVARRRAQTFGVTNVEFQTGDAQRIELPDASVDGVLHRFGPMLLPDPAASAAEVRRVLVDGGRYVTAVWGGPDANPWILMMGMSLMQNGHQTPGDPFGPGAMFSLADPDKLRAAIQGGGFAHVDVEPVDTTLTFVDADELWRLPSEIAGPIAQIIRGLSSEEATAVRATVESSAEPFRTPEGGYRFPAQATCTLAR